MEQIERIRCMEQLYDFVSESITEFPISLDRYEKMQEAVVTLPIIIVVMNGNRIMPMMKQVCFQKI